MNSLNRLEDMACEWSKASEDRLAKAVAAITDDSIATLPAFAVSSDCTRRLAVRQAVLERISEFAAAELLPEILKWLDARGVAMPVSDRIRSDVDLALRQWSPSFDPYLPGPDSRIPFTSLALTAATGAVLGCLAATPLSLLLLGQREPGLLVGGVVGSGLTVGLVTYLSQQPRVLDVLQKVVGSAGIIAALGGAFQVLRGRSLGLLKSAAWIAGCWLVLLIARPRVMEPSREECRDALRPQVDQLLSRAVDLALMLCWCHPDRTVHDPAARSVELPLALPMSLTDALGVLQTVSADQDAPDKHRAGAVRSVLQRVRELGYEWQTVPAGTPYEANLLERFDCFDQVTVGQKVETLEPALLCRGKLVKQGLLRSFHL
jgi:hypothetical protein